MTETSKPAVATKRLDRERYIPIYIQGIANKLARGASKIYLTFFEVGIIEWRILSILSLTTTTTANEICERIDLDKAAASRSIRTLEERGYVTTAVDDRDTRKRTIQLTPAGAALHDQMIEIALVREARLLRGFSKQEVTVLLNLFNRMSQNIASIDDYDYAAHLTSEAAAAPKKSAAVRR